MNNREAQFILSAYRPGGEDAGDPCFAEALEQARRDPALGSWFEREQACDRLIAERLATVRPPADLRAAILAGGKISRPAPVFAQPWVRALAACAVVLLGLGFFWQQARVEPAPLAAWQAGALDFLDHEPRLDHEAPEVAHLVSWLAEKRAPVPGRIPADLRALKAAGCKVLEVNGRSVSVLCFHRAGGGLVHLVVTSGHALPTDEPQWETVGGWTTASWSEGGQDLMLVTDRGREALTEIL